MQNTTSSPDGMHASEALWGGRFEDSPTEFTQAFGASLPVDKRMWESDIEGSKAHALMLARQGVISDEDAASIRAGLDVIAAQIDEGDFEFDIDDEDIHMSIERNLTEAIGAAGGCGVPTIKPWNIDTVKAKMDQAKASGCFAVAMDVDAAGLPFLKNMTPPAGSKSVAELKEIVALAGRPFIVKGVMTVKGALKAKEAGAAAIVVSNHGGRVLDQCPATAEVLPEIAAALKGTGVKVLVDGGIRTGVDVFKALALGADGVLICRPFVTAVYGGGAEGVKCYIDKLAGELADTMQMCGAHSIEEITPDMVRV